MSSGLLSISNNEALRVLDAELPLLASEAAIDLDNLLAGRDSDLTVIHSLAHLLKNFINFESEDSSSNTLMDFATISVLSEAIVQTRNDFSYKKIEELLKEAEKIASELLSDELLNNAESLKRARDFCVALSTAVMAFHKSIRDLRPPYPFIR